MSNQELKLIGIGFAKRALLDDSRERKRMSSYASVLQEYHLIVFTKRQESLPSFIKDGNLFIYGTNARTKIGMLVVAILIGRKILKQQSAGWIVSSQDPFETSLVGRWIVCGTSAIHHVQIHGDVFNPFSYKTVFFQRLRAAYGRFVVRRAIGIRVVSERIKRSLSSLGVSPARVTVLPIQSDLESFLIVGRSREYEFNRPIRFLYVGRFSSEKNLLLLLEAFALAVVKHPTTTLTIVGDGPDKNAMVNKVAQLGLSKKVIFLEWTDDVSGVMKEADIFCLASKHEGWGMVLVEAAAAGLAIVTTDVGCAGEFVINEETGLVVQVGDAAAYRAALLRYLDDPLLIAEHGRKGHHRAASFKLTEAEYLHRFRESYLSLL